MALHIGIPTERRPPPDAAQSERPASPLLRRIMTLESLIHRRELGGVPSRVIQPILRRAPGNTVALKVALEGPIRYFATLAPLLHRPDRGEAQRQAAAGKRLSEGACSRGIHSE